MGAENKEVDPTADVIKRFGALETDNQKLKTDLAEMQVRFERSEKNRVNISLPGTEDKPLSLSKIIRGLSRGGLDNERAWEDAGHEREVGLETRKRSLLYGTPSAGGYLVPEQAMRPMIEKLRAESVCYESGAVDFGGLVGSPVPIPRQSGGATATWTAENADFTPSDLALEEINLTPHKLTGFTILSNELIMLGTPDAESIVRNDLMSAMSLALDLAILRGTGASNQPTGIRHSDGIYSVGTVGAPTVDDLNDWLYSLQLSNSARGKLGIVWHPRVTNSFRKLKDEEGRYILQPDLTRPFTGTILGIPYRSTTALPIVMNGDTDTGGAQTEAYFCNWSDVLVGRWGGMELRASDTAADAFRKDQTHVRCKAFYDVALRHPESCLYANGITV